MNHLITLTEEGSPFRVADNHIRAADFAEHSRGDLTGKCPFFRFVEVLRGQTDCRSPKNFCHGIQRGERRGNDDFDPRGGGQGIPETRGEIDRLGNGFVHFPISGDNRLHHFTILRIGVADTQQKLLDPMHDRPAC